MLKLPKYIALLTFYLLVIGFQFSGNYGSLYAATSTSELTVSNTVLSTRYYTTEAKTQNPQAIDIIAEMIEFNKEEENMLIQDCASYAVSHAYFNSFLRFSLLDLDTSKKFFNAVQLRAATHLYLQFQVFRL